MLNEIAKTNVINPNKLIIYDARSYLNAFANHVIGGGFENTKDYQNCEIEFCDIDNIHAVRDAILKMYDLNNFPSILNNPSKFLTMLDNTNWL
jgi:myotubularin-related protein 3/4